MSESHVLIVDDDGEIRELVRLLLEGEGYTVEEAENGEQALEKLNGGTDLVILDVMMPGQNGYMVCKKIRESSIVPILFLTAKTHDSDLITGFSSGGDDYLQKPFSSGELLARVKGLLRRYHSYREAGAVERADDDYIERAGLRVSRRFNEVYKGDTEIPLTQTEYQLLLLMAQYPGKVFSTANLYESVWNEPYFSVIANTVMVHIKRLRKKIEDDPQNPAVITTVWGKGYRIEK